MMNMFLNLVRKLPPDHLLLDSAPNLGPLISRWEINKFESFWYKSVRILGVLKVLFQQFLNLSSPQRDISGPILGALSYNRWSWGTVGPSTGAVYTSLSGLQILRKWPAQQGSDTNYLPKKKQGFVKTVPSHQLAEKAIKSWWPWELIRRKKETKPTKHKKEKKIGRESKATL